MKLIVCAFSMIAISIVANGDTLKLGNNSSLNGKVRYENGVFYIEARYTDATQHYAIPRDQVRSDEINAEDFNQGAPLPDIRAHQIDRYEWLAIDTKRAPSKVGTTTAQRIIGPEKTAQPTARIRETSKTGASVDPASTYLSGKDTLTFTNRKRQTGTLRRMTAEIIIFRVNGERTDKQYARDQVKLVSVKKSG